MKEDNGQHAWVSKTYGKSFRDEIATIAFDRILTDTEWRKGLYATTPTKENMHDTIAAVAYALADAMIAEKDREEMKRKYILVTGGVYTDVTEKIEALIKAADDLADDADRCNSNDWNEHESIDNVREAIKELK